MVIYYQEIYLAMEIHASHLAILPSLLYRYHEQDQTPDSVYLDYDDLFSGNEWSIYTAMSSTMAFNSTLPRDRVYGLLAFASPISRAAIGMDYSGQKTDADVFQRVHGTCPQVQRQSFTVGICQYKLKNVRFTIVGTQLLSRK